ncbi:MAG: DUF1292 domain-containing protein [Oscillospiraceae bacterium]|nr:DUF1292 domain-containing protein [Oscillospiraceae bacterium]
MSEFEKDNQNPNNGEFEPDIVELDGEPFEIIDAMEYEGANYLALIPYDENADFEDMDGEEETEFIVLREVEENGEYFLSTIDDDRLSDKIGDLFLARFDALFSESGESELN